MVPQGPPIFIEAHGIGLGIQLLDLVQDILLGHLTFFPQIRALALPMLAHTAREPMPDINRAPTNTLSGQECAPPLLQKLHETRDIKPSQFKEKLRFSQFSFFAGAKDEWDVV